MSCLVHHSHGNSFLFLCFADSTSTFEFLAVWFCYSYVLHRSWGTLLQKRKLFPLTLANFEEVWEMPISHFYFAAKMFLPNLPKILIYRQACLLFRGPSLIIRVRGSLESGKVSPVILWPPPITNRLILRPRPLITFWFYDPPYLPPPDSMTPPRQLIATLGTYI